MSMPWARKSTNNFLDAEPSDDKAWRGGEPRITLTVAALLVFFVIVGLLEVFKGSQDELLQSHIQALRIPRQLVLTAKQASLDELPKPVQENIRRTLSLSPGVHLRWLSDDQCHTYIQSYYDQEMVRIFAEEVRGSFRGDICRACVLAREGGFYLDLDVQLKVPLEELVDPNTTFATAYTEDGAVLNALLAASPGNAVMKEVVNQIRMWYTNAVEHQDWQTTSEWLGPVTMLRAIREVSKRDCSGESHDEAALQWKCGPHVFRMYREADLDCYSDTEDSNIECPPIRRDSEFNGVRFGIFTPSPEHRIVAWPRFETCRDWGCAAGGWDESPVIT